MLIKLNKLIDKVKKAYDEYEFAVVYHSIHNFCTIELSSFYLDFAKDIVYIEHADHPDRREHADSILRNASCISEAFSAYPSTYGRRIVVSFNIC
nr:class I tRNA ligase family protein [Bacillus subtilis]